MNNGIKSGIIAVKNSEVLLNYDYKKLERDVAKAVIACPAIISVLRQRDLSLLTGSSMVKTDIHMMACIRMTCAFLGIKDPFPCNRANSEKHRKTANSPASKRSEGGR